VSAPTSQLPIFRFPDKSKFLPVHALPTTESPWTGWSVEDLRGWVMARWQDAFEYKRAENARLELNSTYYDGFHYSSAWLNKTMPIENRIYEFVEALVSNTIAVKPRPEIQPMRTMDAKRAQRLREFSNWYMDTAEWDYAEELSTRDKKIYGYSIRLISFDYQTGMPYPKPFSLYDYYPDPSGIRDDDRSFWFLAGPKNTNRLCAMYPTVADQIRSDNMASPSYNAVERPWLEYLEEQHQWDHPVMADAALAIHREEDTETESTILVTANADRREQGTTTFVLQMIVRDDAMCDQTFWGTQQSPKGIQTHGMKYTAKGYAKRSESGFWIISMTAQGVFLHDPRPLDDCYLGLPWVVDMEEQRTDRPWSRSPIDQAIPIQRALNRTNHIIDRNLELAGDPLLKTNDGKLSQQLQGGPINGGDILEMQMGRDATWLELKGPSAQQFERVQERRGAMRDIVGVQGAMEGARPPGIEAAAALRNLDNASMRRVRGKENPAHRARSLLLRKCMYAAGKKLQPEITFMASNGDAHTVTSDDLADLFRIRFAPGSGTVEGVADKKDEALALYDREIIDEEEVLDVLQWPDAAAIAQRMMERKLVEKIQMAAAAAASGGPPGKNGSAKKGSPVGARG
jgi:hypothetical protein